MAFLKEDGSLDIDRINSLPLEEWMDAMGELTKEQFEEYLSKVPLLEPNGPVQPIVVDYTLEDELERGGVIAEDFINNLRERLKRNE